jgi:hypothetical protein
MAEFRAWIMVMRVVDWAWITRSPSMGFVSKLAYNPFRVEGLH